MLKRTFGFLATLILVGGLSSGCKKDSGTNNQNGDWKLTITVIVGGFALDPIVQYVDMDTP